MTIVSEGFAEVRALWRGEARGMTRETLPAIVFADTEADVAITPRSALGMLDVFAAIRRLADGASSLPLVTYRRLEGGDRERAQAPVVALLDRPAPASTQAALIGTVVAHLAGWGNAFVGKYRGESGQVEQLGVLPPDRVQVKVLGGIPTYVYSVDGRQMELTTDDILHIRTLSLDGHVGLSPIRQAREDLALSHSVRQAGSSFYANDARPAGILAVAGNDPDADEILENTRQGFNREHQGPPNRGRIAFVRADTVSYQALSVPLADAQWIEARRLARVEVATLFGLPAWILNADAGSSLTYSNVTDQARAFLQWSLRPYTTAIEQAINQDRDLCPRDSGLFCEFLFEGALRGSPGERAELYERAIAAGWMTVDDVRRAENLPPLEENSRA